MSSKQLQLLALAATLAALSGTAVAGPSIDDLATLAAEVREAQLRAQLAEAQLAERKAKEAAEAPPEKSNMQGPGALPLPPGAPVESKKDTAPKPDDIRLMAVYGIEDNLRAEISFNSRTVMASMAGNRQVGPWKITAITPYKVSLARSGTGKDESRDVYLGNESIDLFARPVEEQRLGRAPGAGSSPSSPGFMPLPGLPY